MWNHETAEKNKVGTIIFLVHERGDRVRWGWGSWGINWERPCETLECGGIFAMSLSMSSESSGLHCILAQAENFLKQLCLKCPVMFSGDQVLLLSEVGTKLPKLSTLDSQMERRRGTEKNAARTLLLLGLSGPTTVWNRGLNQMELRHSLAICWYNTLRKYLFWTGYILVCYHFFLSWEVGADSAFLNINRIHCVVAFASCYIKPR